MGKFAMSPLGIVASIGRQRLVARRVMAEVRMLKSQAIEIRRKIREEQARFDEESQKVIETARELRVFLETHRIGEAVPEEPGKKAEGAS